MPGWKFHTHVTPNEQDKMRDPLTKAFNSFLQELLIDEDVIKKTIRDYQKKYPMKPYKLIIDTRGNKDRININSNHIFLKSIFLKNRKFKQKLVEYYNPRGIFVKGPKEIFVNNESINQWEIGLSILYSKNDDDEIKN